MQSNGNRPNHLQSENHGSKTALVHLLQPLDFGATDGAKMLCRMCVDYCGYACAYYCVYCMRVLQLYAKIGGSCAIS